MKQIIKFIDTDVEQMKSFEEQKMLLKNIKKKIKKNGILIALSI